jgi:hypothetical protein
MKYSNFFCINILKLENNILAGIIGIIFAYLINSLIFHIFIKVMYYIYNYEYLDTFDAIFFLDDHTNNSILLGVWILEKFDYQEMKKYIYNKTQNIHKARSKLEKKFGLYWYVKMDE